MILDDPGMQLRASFFFPIPDRVESNSIPEREAELLASSAECFLTNSDLFPILKI
jgi:hypothetical protein